MINGNQSQYIFKGDINYELAPGTGNQDRGIKSNSKGSYPFVDVHFQSFVVDWEQVAVRTS